MFQICIDRKNDTLTCNYIGLLLGMYLQNATPFAHEILSEQWGGNVNFKLVTDNNLRKMFENMMPSSNGKIFRVTGHLCGEFTGLR